MHLVTTNESRVLVDCGAKPTMNHSEVQPFFVHQNYFLWISDAIVLTHAHVDHIAMLPVLFRYGYRGPVYCTPPTRDLMTLLQMDYIKVSQAEGAIHRIQRRIYKNVSNTLWTFAGAIRQILLRM